MGLEIHTGYCDDWGLCAIEMCRLELAVPCCECFPSAPYPAFSYFNSPARTRYGSQSRDLAQVWSLRDGPWIPGKMWRTQSFSRWQRTDSLDF